MSIQLSADIGADLILWDEVIPGGAYWSRVIKRGTTLRITDLEGCQGVSFLCYNADNLIERYNAADTVKIPGKIFLTKGMVLYSDMGRVLFSIVEDTCGAHDTLSGCSNAQSNLNKYGDGEERNSRDNFMIALSKHGLGKKDIMPNINFFSQVVVEEDGKMVFKAGCEQPGSFIDLRAEMNVLAVISNCPHVLNTSNTYSPTEIRVTVWNSPPAAADDLCRTSSPESIRGFQNTDALFI